MKKKLTAIIATIATATMAITAMPVNAMDIPEDLAESYTKKSSAELVQFVNDKLSDTLDEIYENPTTSADAIKMCRDVLNPYGNEIEEKFRFDAELPTAVAFGLSDSASHAVWELGTKAKEEKEEADVMPFVEDLIVKVRNGEMRYNAAANELGLRILEEQCPDRDIRAEYAQGVKDPKYAFNYERGDFGLCDPGTVLNIDYSPEYLEKSQTAMGMLSDAYEETKMLATPVPSQTAAPTQSPVTVPATSTKPDSGTAVNTGFTDTNSLNDVQISAINDAVEKGIITGYEDNTVRPYGTLTRAEFAAMVCRYKGYEILNNCSFMDAVSHWSSKYIQSCVEKGAINGIGDNLFDPESPVTFYQATKIVSIISGMTNGADIDGLGGYPTAYLTVGQDNGLFENLTYGITGEDYSLSRIDAIIMLSNITPVNSPLNSDEKLKKAIENSIIELYKPEEAYERIINAIDGYIEADMHVFNKDYAAFLHNVLVDTVSAYFTGEMGKKGGPEWYIKERMSDEMKANPELPYILLPTWTEGCKNAFQMMIRLTF